MHKQAADVLVDFDPLLVAEDCPQWLIDRFLPLTQPSLNVERERAMYIRVLENSQ